jgi:catechol 2,3-dioxygenase-like lactoylglutathione lyase family enzyme
MAAVSMNHVGLCVTDLERSRRFYEQALGFRFERSIQPPDGVCSTLLGVDLPVGLTAVYLTNGGFVLELLQFERPGNPASRRRPMNEPGLTHLSVSTPDLAATVALVPTLGGQVLGETDVGAAVMIRDPDGQLLELLPAAAS